MKLYDMSDEPERRAFLDKLIAYQEERGTPISQCPTISKLPLDLYRLYMAVKERGGLVEVSRGKLWKECTVICNIATSSSAAYTLRKQYIKHLFPFECKFDRGGVDPQPILASLEGSNRKKNKNAVPPPEPPFQGHPGQPSMDGYGPPGSYPPQPFPPPNSMSNSEYPPQPPSHPPSGYPHPSGPPHTPPHPPTGYHQSGPPPSQPPSGYSHQSGPPQPPSHTPGYPHQSGPPQTPNQPPSGYQHPSGPPQQPTHPPSGYPHPSGPSQPPSHPPSGYPHPSGPPQGSGPPPPHMSGANQAAMQALTNHNESISVKDPFADDIQQQQQQQHGSGYPPRSHSQPPTQASGPPSQSGGPTPPQHSSEYNSNYNKYSNVLVFNDTNFNAVPAQPSAQPNHPPPQNHFGEYNDAYNRQSGQNDPYVVPPPQSQGYPPTRMSHPSHPSPYYNQQQGYVERERTDSRFEGHSRGYPPETMYGQQPPPPPPASVGGHPPRGQYPGGPPSGQPTAPHPPNTPPSSTPNYSRGGPSPIGQYGAMGQQIPYNNNSSQENFKSNDYQVISCKRLLHPFLCLHLSDKTLFDIILNHFKALVKSQN